MPGKKKFCKRRLLREATKRVQNSVLYHWPLTVRLSFFFFFFPLLRLLLVRIGESTRGEVASTRFARENWPLVKEAICNSRGLILRGNDRLGTLPPPPPTSRIFQLAVSVVDGREVSTPFACWGNTLLFVQSKIKIY